MARLSIQPLAGTVTRPLSAFTDERVSAVIDGATGALNLKITNKDGQPAATLVVSQSLTGDPMPERVDVVLSVRTDAVVAARVNKLLEGMLPGNTTLRTYHRTGVMTLLAPGRPVAVPATFTLVRQHQGDYQLRIRATAPNTAPTVPPVAPAPEPVAPVAPPVAPVTPPPAVAPSAPVRIPTPPPGGLFRMYSRQTTHEILTDATNKKKLWASWERHLSGDPGTVALVGPAGTGKTSILEYLCAERGIGMYTVDGPALRSFTDWTGQTGLSQSNGATVTEFEWADFITAVRIDGPYGGIPRIVRIDEVNRSESGGALNALMPILEARSLSVPEARTTIDIDPLVMFAFTMNRGSVFGGAHELDAALVERMQMWIRLDYLPMHVETKLVQDRVPGTTEVQAAQLVNAAVAVRASANRQEIRKGVSTRMILNAASFLKFGLSTAEAAIGCWADSYADEGADEGERGQVVSAIRSAIPA
jgi:hypothetical protein